jgi:uncharacterized protein (DUF2164 family)
LGNELEPDRSLSRSERQLQQQKIEDYKNRSLEISLGAVADEFESRLASGKLAKDLKKMKTPALLGNLTRISAAIKQASVIIIPGSQPMRDITALKAQSATQLSDYERQQRRKNAESVDAEIVDK